MGEQSIAESSESHLLPLTSPSRACGAHYCWRPVGHHSPAVNDRAASAREQLQPRETRGAAVCASGESGPVASPIVRPALGLI